MPLEIEQFGCRSDNFGVLLHDPASGGTVSIDAPEAEPILRVLEKRGWALSHILCTHHHTDHVEGNAVLVARTGAELIGPAAEAGRISGLDRTVGGGDVIELLGTRVEVIDVPGHTLGQIAYHWPEEGRVFTADSLFSLGCGRVFEGTMDEMHASLERLKALPPETLVHCGHEYTAANARFALEVDPDNAALRKRAAEVEDSRARGEPTLPVRLDGELATNPFLRTHDSVIRSSLGMGAGESDAAVFAALRRRKDAA